MEEVDVLKRNICIDIDGTITDPYYFLKYLNELTGKNILPNEYISTNWNEVFGSEFNHIYKDFDDKFTDLYEKITPKKDAVDVINKLFDSQDNIYIITSRKKSIEKTTIEWLDKYNIKYTKLFSLGGSTKKEDVASELNCDFFLEDDPYFANGLIEKGYKVILFDTYYNRYLMADNVIRVADWAEVNNILK